MVLQLRILKTAANTSNVLNAHSFMSSQPIYIQRSYLERSPSVSVAQLYYYFCWNNNIIVASMCDVIKRSIYLSIIICSHHTAALVASPKNPETTQPLLQHGWIRLHATSLLQPQDTSLVSIATDIDQNFNVEKLYNKFKIVTPLC